MERLFVLLVFSFSCANCIKVYDDKPRIYVRDGDLNIIAAPGKSVNVMTRGESSVFSINNINVLTTLLSAFNATRLTKSYQNTLVSYNDRLEALENRGLEPPPPATGNSSMDGQVFRLTYRLYSLTARIGRVERMLRNLTLLLSVDECLSNPCKNGGTCQDMYGKYSCLCMPGWEGTDCSIDVNECTRIQGTDLGCQNGGVCRNTIGSYVCECVNGFIGFHCTKKTVDCLTAGAELCGRGTCVAQNTEKGYKCLCDPGWTTESTGLACTKDVDECQLNHPPCAPGVSCINVPGSFFCGSCPIGFTGNGYHCADINECDHNNGGCSLNPMVMCINTHGSRVCGPCPAGYAGDGVSCSYQGVCNVNNGGCHPLATCHEGVGFGTKCSCPVGYIGNGIGPNGCVRSNLPIDPCSSRPCLNGICSVNASTGTYQCDCFRHYRGKNCDVLAADACTPNPCMNGGECQILLYRRIRCRCKTGFTGKYCSTELQGCGGVLRETNGTIKYPSGDFDTYNHRSSCVWSIWLNDTSKIIKINITSFDLEESPSCRKDWLEIHDGRTTAAPAIGKFCGKKLPMNGTFTSTHDSLYFWFRSDGRVSGGGFELTWKAVTPICDKYLIGKHHGSINSPGAPGNYPLNRDCHWKLFTSLGKRFMFHFFSLNIGDNSDCSGDYIKFYSITYSALGEQNLFAKFCNSSSPAPFYSPGNRATIHFHSDNKDTYPGFQLTFSEVEGVPGCGGTFSKPRGIIQSAITGAGDIIICEYKIQQPSGRKIKINFLKFDLENIGGCSFNYLEIFEGNNDEGPSLGKFCGNTLPAPFTSHSSELTLISSISGLSGDKGWKIEYTNVCGKKFSDKTGQFNSTVVGLDASDCIYEIIRPLGDVIMLTMKINMSPIMLLRTKRALTTFGANDNCYNRFVEVRDGDHENATLIGKYCGFKTVNVASTHNALWIRMRYNSRFILRSAMVPVMFEYTSLTLGCGGILRDKAGNIASPSHPDGYYPSNLKCTWAIIAPPNNVIKLIWMTFHIEESSDCFYDSVQVFDNNTDLGTGVEIGKYCGFKVPPTLLSTSNVMTVVFKTDVTVNMNGFYASYITLPEKDVCGGNYFTPSGVIKSPRYPETYPNNRECVWTISVPPGQQIMLNVTDFSIEYYSVCRYDWFEIRNGGTSASPLIGKYCGTTIPKIITSHTNKMYLFFKSDLSRGGRGFRITWTSTATGCGGILTSPTGSIISPHYPEPYSRNTECLWKIITSAGSRIQIVFSDINLEKHVQCMSDYVQIFDGLTLNSNSLGKFCFEAPNPVKSSANELLVKFRSDVAFQGRGFQLHYTTVCRNEIRGFGGVIESPNFPNDYPEDQDCLWELIVPDKNKINVTFSHFELERSVTYANNSCMFDYVELSYGQTLNDYEDRTYSKYGKFCGQQNPGHISFDADHVRVRFVSDKLMLGSGFRLEWEIFGCGGILRKKTGTISSPNYPNPYLKSTVCEWRIEVDFGQSIQLEFHEVDIEKDSSCEFDSISVYNGINDTYNLLSKICRQKQKTIVSSTGNYMFVVFKSDTSYQGKGFIANYSTIPTTCGGKMTAVEGYIFSPNYPKNYNKNETCEWLIEVDDGHAVEIQFEDVDLFRSDDCKSDYVKIHDGPSGAFPVLKTVCGTTTPNDTIRSSYNNVFIEFRSHYFFTSKGFKLKYVKSCGSRITTQGSGIIEVHQDEFSDELQECHWIISSVVPSKHVSLTISRIFTTNYCEEYDGILKIYNGESNDSPLIGQYCGPKVPPTIVSDGSSLTINLTSISTFFASYSILDTQCGGVLTSTEGYFATPGYPKKYAADMECEWTIEIAPGNHVTLSFIDFKLIQSENCNTDYLEIRSFNGTGKLLGVFCGNDIPENITHVGSIWMLYKGSKLDKGTTDITAKGFYGEYYMNTYNELNGTKGEIWSPLYPLSVMEYKTFSYKITVNIKKRILLSFIEFYLDAKDSFDDECYFASIEIFDGVDETAETLGKYCGLIAPAPIKSTSNILMVRVEYNQPRLGSKFKLVWEQVEGTNPTLPKPLNNTNCGNLTSGEIDITGKRNFTLTSPGYPGGYEPSLKCEWVFMTNQMNHLVLYFLDLDLAVFNNRMPVYQNCEINDRVNIYQKHFFDNDWKKIKTVCKLDEAYQRIVATDLMKIEFITTRFLNGTGFKAKILEGCGGWLRDPTGYIIYDNSSVRSLECQWNITVASTKKIELTFEEMNIDYDANKGCNNFLMIRNGKFADSPLLGVGKYCGTTLPEKLRSTSNNLYIKYSGTPTLQSFRLKYQEVSADCGGRIELTKFDNSTEILSPNYPNIPSPHIECKWLIVAPIGESLRIDFKDRFDLATRPNCDVEYVELRDGGTEHSKLIGRFCGTIPNSQFSTDHLMFIKFFTDTDDPRNGFKAQVSLERCGGTVRGNNGQISYVNAFSASINCTWHIIGPTDHYLTLNFAKLDIGKCADNYILLDDRNPFRTINGTFGKICNNAIPKPIITSHNEVIIRFISKNTAKFLLNFNASQTECGGDLSGDIGVIKSPGYPLMNHLNRYCKWRIEVPKGKRISLTFKDIDFGTVLRYERGIAVYDGINPHLNRPITILTRSQGNNTVESSDNKMSVAFWSPSKSDHRGFEAIYTSNLPTICEGDFSKESGVIKTPPSKNTNYHCEWSHTQLDSSESKTFAFTVSLTTNVTTQNPTSCTYSQVFVEITNEKKDVLGKICKSTVSPVVYRSPFAKTNLEVLANPSAVMNFTVTYTTHDCGGILSGHRADNTIKSPNYPQKPAKSYECAWLLVVDEGEVLNVTVSDIDLGEDCEKSHIIIYNGGLPTDPKIGKFCKQSKPEILISQGNKLLIEYKHDVSTTGGTFQMKYEAASLDCGGIFHDKNRNIRTPNYGNGGYPNNAECLWIIHSEPGYHIKLNFIDRFHLEQSNNCVNDYIEVWQWEDEKWVSLGRKCGRETPNSFESSGDKMKILFRSNDQITGGGFKASWEWLCGGKFVATNKPHYIVSPGYPSAYQKNLNCEYTLTTASPNYEAVNIRFHDFLLEHGTPDCKFDNLTIQARSTPGGYVYTKSTYCGDKIPPPLRLRGVITITFKTDMWLNKRGFKLEYSDDSCGGIVNQETIIHKETPESIDTGANMMRYYQPKIKCVWNITAPQNQIVTLTILKLELSSMTCFGEALEAYNGFEENRNKRLVRICGILEEEYQILSEGNKMMVKLESLPHKYAFKALIEFAHGPAEGCGGSINLTETKTITSPNLENLDCSWKVIAPRDYQIDVVIEKLDVLSYCGEGRGKNKTCDCTFLEIRDGASPLSERIDMLCTPVTQPSTRRTSANSAYIRLLVRGQKNNALKITLRPVMSICGPSVLPALNEKKELTSPNFGSSYPAYLKCTYLIYTKGRFDKIIIHFDEFDLTDESPTSNQCQGDHIQIYEDPNTNTFNGLGGDAIYKGAAKSGSLIYSDAKGRHHFCGHDFTPFDYYANGNVTVSFVSKGKMPKGKGFKLSYSVADCNRNYTESNGRITNGNGNTSDCTFYILAPENYTISVYFSWFYMYYTANCTESYFEVRDGSPTGTVLSRVCGYRLPDPVFSLTNKLYFKAHVKRFSVRYDFLYTTSIGRGCGGEIFNNKGKVFSPLYPNPFRNDSVCTWTVRVPANLDVAFKFTTFDIQGKCEAANVKIETIEDGITTSLELCSSYVPAAIYRSESVLKITYTSSVHNGGSGWIGNFQAVPQGLTELS